MSSVVADIWLAPLGLYAAALNGIPILAVRRERMTSIYSQWYEFYDIHSNGQE